MPPTFFEVTTEGREREFILLGLFLGRGTTKIEGSSTIGDVDEDYLRIRISAVQNNLLEEEAIELVDKIRNELPMNQ